MSSVGIGALPRFIVLYALMYGAFGVASPFWPRFFEARGLAPSELGILFGLGTMMRLIAGPVAGRIADLLHALRAVLGLCALAAVAVALMLLPAAGFWLLLLISLAHAAALAPITTLADALAVNAAGAREGQRKNFEYGYVRGAASAAFILGTLAAGQVLGSAGLSAIVWMHAGLLAGAVLAAALVPALDTGTAPTTPEERSPLRGIAELYRIALFRRVVLLAALIYGSHAMYDAFAVIRWHAAGIGPATASVLWSESVAAEVVIFFLVGPALIRRIGPGGAAALAAAAGVLRWMVMAQTADVVALALVQPLHGFTFALLHLAAMRLIGATVPPQLAATAQALYAFGGGLATALLILLSGGLYERFGGRGFLLMALLCAAALPLTLRLRAAAGHSRNASRGHADGGSSPRR